MGDYSRGMFPPLTMMNLTDSEGKKEENEEPSLPFFPRFLETPLAPSAGYLFSPAVAFISLMEQRSKP